jgi:hypothetical protein
VLIVVLMVMLTLLGVGVMTLWLTSANLQVGGTVNLRTQALYDAEAGIERAAAALNAQANPVLNTLLAGSSGALDDVPPTNACVDPTTGMPNGVGAIFIDGATPLRNIDFPPASFGRTSGTAEQPVSATMGRYTVWIRNDLAELRAAGPGVPCSADTNNTIVLRSRGLASDGRTNVVLEVTMIPSTLVGGGPGIGGASTAPDCIAGKNACDDNSSTQYGISFGN